MKTYFSKISADHWTAKNNLEKEAHKLGREMERRIIPEQELKAFKKELSEKIDNLNKQFTRCKPLSFSIHGSYDNSGDYTAYCDGVFNMGIYLAKTE